ncbi:CHASE2 domain-containing protein [Nostoc sp. CHAB 5836]|uniref:CHASE2 domain-containing protein n=1 Tax=Nostoc sp. CHAB 5836 TaxID=2780404 RepID=UPI001E3C31B3|nr:CHASE2 domain-containing protein [Nostoc sp. CHAB 5836]MCC5619278.1 CHASE2 domain-containing protein [Nostoc sp. CHAB 5836]
MSKLVILKIGEGNFEQGFPVILQIGEEGKPFPPPVQVTGNLPPKPEIIQLYDRWRLKYDNIGDKKRALEKPNKQITNVSIPEDCQAAAQRLSNSLNQWLQSREFLRIRDKLHEEINSSEVVRFFLETEDIQIQRLPWQEWDFFANYNYAEIAVIPRIYKQVKQSIQTQTQVKILAIIGDGTGINIEEDKRLLEELPNANIKFLVEPKRQKINDKLWEEGWDILFFAGHSKTESETGRIYINETDSLTILDLKLALRRAISTGLKIAIFNSCDGLGLARNLAQLHIPQTIVMREPVLDNVAQEFLKYFLREFSQGESFYLAVRKARERLHGLENEYPCASWLPVIYQNPAHQPPLWQDLVAAPLQALEPNNQPAIIQLLPQITGETKNYLTTRTRFLPILIASLLTTGIVLGVRQTGVLEKVELVAFNQLMQLRPEEKPDDRILVVEATEQDINKYSFPLPDGILAQAINKLDQYQPQFIGLDIFREIKREPGHAELVKHFEQNDRLIAVCRVPDSSDLNNPGVLAPPKMPADGVGFADVVIDSDRVLRRHLLFITPEQNSACNSDNAFNVLLAINFLETKGIKPTKTSEGNLQLGNVVFTPLPVEDSTGGYHKIDGWGTQILLNYRASRKIAETVTITQVLNSEINPEMVRGRIVMIGVTGRTAGDYINTPYGEIPGVLVQAHMVSQILSAVLDKRPLMKIWPMLGEILWVWGWSLMGVLLVWLCPSRFVILAIASTSVMLMGSCLILLIQGYWVPVVPSILVLVITSTVVKSNYHNDLTIQNSKS